jgi:hypothetical protein
MHDEYTLTQQENRARAVIAGDASVKGTRFVKTTAAGRILDEASLEKARSLAGLKGYVTNIEAGIMPAAEVLSSYHGLWHVEQSFRMSKTDLQARPVFHNQCDAIEAQLTIVFTALAIARYLQDKTGYSIRRIIRTLKPLLEVQINIGGPPHRRQSPYRGRPPHLQSPRDSGRQGSLNLCKSVSALAPFTRLFSKGVQMHGCRDSRGLSVHPTRASS